MPVTLILKPHEKDLGGGFMVRRLLPAAARQGVGPFLFFDHFGPETSRPEDNHDVRPHPHIGLATVTYLFEGAILHRDHLGSVQRIEPGAINWMTAGRGIVHSERTPPDLRDKVRSSHGLQLWCALPLAHEETEPAFHHTPAAAMPEHKAPGVTVRVLVGSAFGLTSPVQTFVSTLYLDFNMAPGTSIEFTPEAEECGLYSVDKPLVVDGAELAPHLIGVLEPGRATRIEAPQGARFVAVGGAPLDGHRHMWWNFVSSSRERIEQAKADWEAQRMGQIPGETEFIPLPQK
jgi:redox-sensitive bicupin YhaK (pirin superfamily)